MKRVFDDYGGVVITVIAVVALLGLVVFLMSDTGVMSNAFSKITGQMVDKSEQVIDDVGSLVDRAPSVEELQEEYTFEYYSTLNGAVNDVNAGTIGANADVDKADAVAGIYTDRKGGINVVLLKDTTEATRVSPAVDMTINLGGKLLKFSDTIGMNITTGNVFIDGRIDGSSIEFIPDATDAVQGIRVRGEAASCIIDGGTFVMKNGGTSNSINAVCINVTRGAKLTVSNAKVVATHNYCDLLYGIQVGTDGDATIKNCDITVEAPNKNAVGILVVGSVAVSDCNISATSAQGDVSGVMSSAGSGAHITNCTITATTDDGKAQGVFNEGEATVANCDIKATAADGKSWGVTNNGTGTITNCDIKATAADGYSHGVTNEGTATVINCDIRAYSNYHKDGAGYSASSNGVQNASNGTLTINDCYVFGTHSGLQNNGTLYVNGGTYEGYGHGGIYFAGAGTTAYVSNATLKDSLTMPEGYTGTSQHNGAGFYIGGNVGMDNIRVYMDNCKIYGAASQIVLRGSSGEQNNTLYISRSKLYDLDGNTLSVRIDNDTHKLYIGKGCNFTAENTTLPGAVVVTDEVYVQE